MATTSDDSDIRPLFEAVPPERSLAQHRHELLRRLLETQPDGQSQPATRTAAHAVPGSRIGRYVVLESLGQGGMGVVLRAYDPKLQREVALKVMQSGPHLARSRARMLREARAMARLNHPNVVSLYDAEPEAEFGVVVAMELVQGKTLHDWLATSRGWRDILETFIAAGRGLAAAHAAGVLHRDFKPANVLVGADGRTRVTDFGLAWTLARSPPERLSSTGGPSTETTSITEPLTNGRGVRGTPAYMAPEQHQGRQPSPATDQYAYCVALWEAFNGERPFGGSSSELEAAKRRGPPPWPGATEVPRVISEAITRGLSPETSGRWPSMEALLATLSRERHRRSRRLAWIGGGTTLALATTMVIGWAQREARCSGAETTLANAWSPARRQAIEEALLETELPFAPSVRDRTLGRLDDYAKRWVSGHREACEATSIRGEQSAATMDLRMACLHRARTELRAAVEILASSEPQVLDHAHDLVDELPPLARCDDLAALQLTDAPPDAQQQEAVAAIREGVAKARALRHVGLVDRGLELVTEQWRATEQVDFDPLVTEVSLELAASQQAVAQFKPAEASYRRALRVAQRGSQAAATVTAASGLLLVVGIELGRPDEALLLADVARGAAERTGDPLHEAKLGDALGTVYRALGRYDEAEAEHRSAIARWERSLGSDSPTVAKARSNLGLVLGMQTRYAEAEAEHRAAVAILERTLGAAHPQVAKSRNNLAIALQRMGLHDEAIVEYEQAIEASRAALGPRHPVIAKLRSNLGGAWLEHGEPKRGVTELREAVAILEAVYGPKHTSVGAARQSLGVALEAAADYSAAIEELGEAVTILQAALGPSHPDVAYARGGLGIALVRQGDYQAAETELRGAIEATEQALGPEHTDAADNRTNLGLVLFEIGRDSEAEAEFEKALAIFEHALGRNHPDVSMALHNLGLTQQRQGSLPEAERNFRRALAIREAALGLDHPDTGSTELALGELLLERNMQQDARAHLERAFDLSQRTAVAPEVAADAAFALARVLWPDASERPRAEELVEDARRRFVALGAMEQDQIERVDAWVGGHH